MCFEILEGMANGAKAIMACICCCLCAGPILIIVGIVLLASPNTREDDVKNYNDAISSYNSNTAPILTSLSLSVEGSSMSRTQESINVQGNTEGVDSGSHYVFTASGVTRPNDNNYGFQASRSGGSSTTFSKNIPFTASVTRDIVCSSNNCAEDCAFRDFECTASSSRNYCTNQFGGVYTHTNAGDCDAGEVCGRCEYQGSLSRACVPIAVSSSSISTSSRYSSCYYPFDISGNDYRPSAGSSPTIEVMSDDDPFIELQRVTEGTNDFGITEAQQRTTGIVLLILGLLITCVMIAAAYFFINRHRKQKEQDKLAHAHEHPPAGYEHHAIHVGQPAEPAQQQPYQQQPYGGKQDPHYNPQYQQQQPPAAGYQQQGYYHNANNAQPQPAYTNNAGPNYPDRGNNVNAL